MPGIKVKLIRSYSGRTEKQKATLLGLGLKRIGQEVLLRDTAPIRGMLFKVQHMLEIEAVEQTPPVRRRPGRPGRKDKLEG